MAQQRQPRDYTRRKTTDKTTSAPAATEAADLTIHAPPGCLASIGVGGAVGGIIANLWQMITSFIAFWVMFEPGSAPWDFQKQPMVIIICLGMSCTFQLSLALVVWRVDTKWKARRKDGGTYWRSLGGAAVELMAHMDLFTIWSFISFAADTVSDFTFITLYTRSGFLIFLYVSGLYAFSTIIFVKCMELVWASFNAMGQAAKGGQA